MKRIVPCLVALLFLLVFLLGTSCRTRSHGFVLRQKVAYALNAPTATVQDLPEWTGLRMINLPLYYLASGGGGNTENFAPEGKTVSIILTKEDYNVLQESKGKLLDVTIFPNTSERFNIWVESSFQHVDCSSYRGQKACKKKYRQYIKKNVLPGGFMVVLGLHKTPQ